MTGSIAVSPCGHTPNRPGHHGTVVASTVGTVATSCNASRKRPAQKCVSRMSPRSRPSTVSIPIGYRAGADPYQFTVICFGLFCGASFDIHVHCSDITIQTD